MNSFCKLTYDGVGDVDEFIELFDWQMYVLKNADAETKVEMLKMALKGKAKEAFTSFSDDDKKC